MDQRGINWAELVREEWWRLDLAPEAVRKDNIIMLDAVEQDGMAMQYASEELRSNRSLVVKAVTKDWHALEFASIDLRSDWEVVRIAVGQNILALRWATEGITGDEELMLAVIAVEWWACQYATEELLAAFPFWEKLLEQEPSSWMALQFAALEVRSDADIVLKAIALDPMAIQFASHELKHQRDFMLSAVQLHWSVLRHAPLVLREDPEIVLAAASQDTQAMVSSGPSLLNSAGFIVSASKVNPRALLYAPEKLRADRDCVQKAVEQNGLALPFAHADFHLDRDLVNASLTARLPAGCSGLLWQSIKPGGLTSRPKHRGPRQPKPHKKGGAGRLAQGAGDAGVFGFAGDKTADGSSPGRVAAKHRTKLKSGTEKTRPASNRSRTKSKAVLGDTLDATLLGASRSTKGDQAGSAQMGRTSTLSSPQMGRTATLSSPKTSPSTRLSGAGKSVLSQSASSLQVAA
mmetsp:Transcript_12244/g.27761  ORF Transcript_12244/g.27761 Transcript_12244/m.27761 type:complete len:463 (-) Transcript_12244:83-1471(-)